MGHPTTVELLTIALELRLAAQDPSSTERRLTQARLMELASILESAAHRVEPVHGDVEVRALKALSRASR